MEECPQVLMEMGTNSTLVHQRARENAGAKAKGKARAHFARSKGKGKGEKFQAK
jgi:hypothetical protein